NYRLYEIPPLLSRLGAFPRGKNANFSLGWTLGQSLLMPFDENLRGRLRLICHNGRTTPARPFPQRKRPRSSVWAAAAKAGAGGLSCRRLRPALCGLEIVGVLQDHFLD